MRCPRAWNRGRSRSVRAAMRRFALVTVCGAALAVGCSRTAPTTELYFLDGQMTSLGWRGQLRAVERSGLERPLDVLRALLAGPQLHEVRRGLVTTIPGGTRLRSLRVSRGTALVDLAGGVAGAGLPRIDFEGAGQIVYTLTSVPGISRVALRHEGRPCCIYRHDGSAIAEPHTRRNFRGWGGEPCEFRETPAPSCSTP
jgi:spore germination protein GerM